MVVCFKSRSTKYAKRVSNISSMYLHIFFLVFFFFWGMYVLYHGYIPGVDGLKVIRVAIPQLAGGSNRSTVPLRTGTVWHVSLYMFGFLHPDGVF